MWALSARAEDGYVGTAYDTQDHASPEGRVIAGEDCGGRMNPLIDAGKREQYSVNGEQGTDVQPDFDRALFDGGPPLPEQPLQPEEDEKRSSRPEHGLLDEWIGSAVGHDRASVDEAGELCLWPWFSDETDGDGDKDAKEPRPEHTVQRLGHRLGVWGEGERL